jgi:hypothetical protein
VEARVLSNEIKLSGSRIITLAALCGLVWIGAQSQAQGQTTLTTIQDTLFTADGTRFTGTLTIQWNTFDTSNGTVVQQTKGVPIVNGNLLVQLTPNATATPPANYYTVSYQSDGKQQFTESWTVPTSSTPLTIRQVRTGGVNTSGTISALPAADVPIAESDVTGLLADLAVRPTKGAAFGSSAVAIVDNNGILETAVGQVGDCVLVDGTTGPCGAPTFVDAETPGGTVDGVNATFTLANAPVGTSLQLYRNGLYQTTGFDFTLTGSAISFSAGAKPQPGDTLTASYRVDPSAAGTSGAAPLSAAVRTTTSAQVLCNAPGINTSTGLWTTLGSCDIPASQLRAGDRLEVRFTFQHVGSSTGFDVQVNWGTTVAFARHGGVQDAALAGQMEAAIGASGAILTTESWGTVLQFLPAILTSATQNGVQVSLAASVGSSTSDSVRLVSFTVLRYPSN